MGRNLVLDKSFDFAVCIVFLNKHLVSDKKEYILSKQIMRSGTAVGALVREAQHAESNADFIYKLSIALKEANETDYWLSLLKDSDCLNDKMYHSIEPEVKALIRILVSSIKTTKEYS